MMENKTQVTVYDIAKMAGVSPSTVSRVLSGHVRVSEDKAERIKALIEEYHFVPNQLARSFYSKKTNNIGMIVPDIRSAFFAKLFVECEQKLSESGYNLILCNTINNLESEMNHLENMSKQMVDMILQVGGGADETETSPEYISLVNRIHKKTPVILMGEVPKTECYHIAYDETESMYRAMEYLYGLGHREIAVIGGYKNIRPSVKKWDAYRTFLKNHDIPLYEPWLIEGDYGPNGGYYGFRELIKTRRRPTAVIAINDEVGFGLLQAGKEHGIEIPKELSLLAFDNTGFSTLAKPQITSVDFHYDLFAQKLLKIVEGEVPVGEVQRVEGTIIERESCGKVNS